MRTLVPDAPETLGPYASGRHRDSNKRAIRAALHVACWVPFITAMVDSWRGPWRAVGDNAHLALASWNTLSGWIPLVGQPNELPGGPHDLGPMEYWLLTVPVHIDTARGVLWGAILLAMLAVSLTVEAGYSVLGETGGLVASGVVIGTVLWYPEFATRPEDNPDFGMIFFIAGVAACLAVLVGHRKWWPVLVVTASIAAQAHLTYAAASVGLVLIAAVTALADGFRARGGYSWLMAGVAAGLACWLAPLEQQFASPPGDGNMSRLLHADSGAPRIGLRFAMKALASLSTRSRLWWGQDIANRHDLYHVLGSQPAALGFVILAIMAASLVMAVFWFRSRELASLAVTSLLVSLSAITSFALIPGYVHGRVERQHDVIFVMFAAAVLAWLTVICSTVFAAVKLIGGRRGKADSSGQRGKADSSGQRATGGRPGSGRRYVFPMPIRGTAALLLVLSVLFSAGLQAARYAGPGTNSLHVNSTLVTIERSLPGKPMIGLSVSGAREGDWFQLFQGLCWGLTANGYRAGTYRAAARRKHNGALTEVAIMLRGSRLTVRTMPIGRQSPGKWRACPGTGRHLGSRRPRRTGRNRR